MTRPGGPVPALRWLARKRRKLVVGAFGAAGAAALWLAAVGYLRSDLQSPPPSLLVSDRNGRFLGELSADIERGHGFWPVAGLPPRVVAATLAVEDRRFRAHPGVDPKAVARALWQNLSAGRRVSGASTLAMQVARLQRPGPRTYGRKAVEASTALWMTLRHGRDAVLAHYLRLVPYGNQAHGIVYAARRYLDKPVADLSWAETAFLAAIPQAPARHDPYDPRGRARAVKRGRQILDLLGKGGVLSRREHTLAHAQIARLRIPPRARRPEAALHAVLRFEEQWASDGDRFPHHRVEATLDLDVQEEVGWRAARRLEEWRRRGAGNAAVIVVDLQGRSGPEVRAAVGSAGYFEPSHAGAIDYTRVPRSSGSTLKPFFYAHALDMGVIDATTVLDDLARGAGGIANADGRFFGPLLPRFALAASRNVPAADLLARLGLQEGWQLLGRLGLHQGGSHRDGAGRAERHGLGLTIGSLAVSAEDLARAYTALAIDGRVRDLRWYRGQPTGAPLRVLSESAARQITLFLSDSQARLPAFPRRGSLELPFPAAFKTGTSSRYRDAWTVAYSHRYLVVVWVGHPDHRPMHRLSGFRSAAELAGEVLALLHPELGDGLSEVGFPPPRRHRPVRVCALTGQGAGPACDRISGAWLPE
ncbi:MAG: transglycosylase domain-containing protein, partial [Holophagales bacterium]|nr:transglycosylase domain-containing protein [Holophagales bacterium]